MSKDLREFLRAAREAGPEFYVEVKKPLKPELETCIIQQKLAKEGRFPLIFCPTIAGSKLPLVTDMFGSRELMGLAMGLDPKKATKADIFHEYRKRQGNIRPVKSVAASKAPVKDVILKGKDVDLGLIPFTHQAVLNSGKYIPIGCMICKHPDTGIPNVGVYRHEIKGKSKLGCMINPGHHGAYIARRHAELGKKMDVAIFIGHHPLVMFGAVYTGALGVNELEVMGGFLQENLEVTRAETVDLPVPAYAEIVIEGVIDPRHMVTDGPYSEYAGYYGEEKKPCYLIDVTAITMRKDAIYHDLDPAHREHNLSCVMSFESATYDAVKAAVPSLKALYMPPSGVNEYHIYLSIAKRIEGEGMHAGLAALAATVNCKMAIVVDEDVDVYNEEEVLWAVATRSEWDEDLLLVPRTTGAHLDPTAYNESRLNRGHMTTKAVIDATRPVDKPFATRITPSPELWQSMRLADYIK